MLPLVLVVHVHAGEEDTVSGMGVDPAQEDDVLPVVNVPHVLQPVHGAAVALPLLLGDQQMTDDELVVAESAPQCSQSLDVLVAVHSGNVEELVDQVTRHGY